MFQFTYPGGHAGFLVVATCTHALVGYTLGSYLFERGWAGLLAAVVADVDLLVPAAWGLPLAHRGITHSALAVAVAVAVATRRDRLTAGAVGVGYASQLLIDATTPMGIPLAYPLSSAFVGVTLHGHSPNATALLWLCCLGLLLHRRVARSDRAVALETR